MTYAPGEDAGQPGHLSGLIKVLALYSYGSQEPNAFHVGGEDSDWAGQLPGLVWIFAGRAGGFVVWQLN